MKTIRVVLILVGVAMIILGGRWILQGSGMMTLGNPAMVGHTQWIPIGGVAALVGLGLILFTLLRKKFRNR